MGTPSPPTAGVEEGLVTVPDGRSTSETQCMERVQLNTLSEGRKVISPPFAGLFPPWENEGLFLSHLWIPHV